MRKLAMRTEGDMTACRMADPQPGDRFYEMPSFWLHVVGRCSGMVAVEEYCPSCRCPEDGKLRLFRAVADFQRAYAYDGMMGDYWVRYSDSAAPCDHFKWENVIQAMDTIWAQKLENCGRTWGGGDPIG